MQIVSAFIFENEYSLYFFYGCAFIITGFVLGTKQTRFKLGNRIWLLAGFALVHGTTELIHSWIYLQKNYIHDYDITLAFNIERILLAASFTLLLYFGIELILIGKQNPLPILRFIPGLLFFGWLIYFFGWDIATKGVYDKGNVYLSIVTARYFLGFPGSLITAVGLILQLKAMDYNDNHRLTKYVKGAAVSFAVYGIMTGIFVRQGDFFPVNLVNSKLLYDLTGIPVEAYRMLCAISIAYFIIKTLQAIDLEVIRRLEFAEVNRAVFEERNRIGRDIHDGVLQSIYSVGLRLERFMLSYRNKMKVDEIKDMEVALCSLNNAMTDMRHFISHLADTHLYPDINSVVDEITKEFKLYQDYHFRSAIHGNVIYLDDDQLVNIYYFIKEALSNSRKHSQAQNISLDLFNERNRLTIRVKDDGVGFDYSQQINEYTGMGLKNMYKRAKMLKGILTLITKPGQGVEIILEMPV